MGYSGKGLIKLDGRERKKKKAGNTEDNVQALSSSHTLSTMSISM